MNSTVSSSPQEQLATSIVTTVGAIISALGVVLVAYLQKRLGTHVRQHHNHVSQRVEHIHEAIKSSQSNQGNSPPISDNGITCPHCVALARD